ncbi:MAG: tyrosine-protein phosphatase [Candidatus Riflebacteria bacterium]|nr:tyrosine-protein phosphatase [Candidatus Riflebacteria bacterium]
MYKKLKFIILSLALFCVSNVVFAESTTIDDQTALLELQKLVAKHPPVSLELEKRIKELIFQIWDKPRFRHQVATLINMNGGYIDGIFNGYYLETLPESEKPLPNFHKVDGKLFRGGQPTEAGLQKLKDMGVTTIVNLRAENNDEEEIVNKLGLKSVWIPIPDTAPAKPDQIQTFMNLLHDKQSGKFFVHCAAGKCRTGTMVALWRIENGMTNKAAFEEAKKFGFSAKVLSSDRIVPLILNYSKPNKK